MSVLTISIPDEEFDNPYVSRELHFHFHYFLCESSGSSISPRRSCCSRAGFGTLDEMFEILTLVQTRKMRKRIQ